MDNERLETTMTPSTTVRTITAALALATALLLGTLATTPVGAGTTRRAAAPEATPVKQADYKFNNTRQSSVAGAPALQDIGPGGANTFATENVDGVNRRVLQFPEANGLQLLNATTVIPFNRYTIALKMRFELIDPYRRIIDYKKNVADAGLYVDDGGLEMYPVSSSVLSPIAADEWVHVVLTRSQAGRLRGYVDGQEQFDVVGLNSGLIGSQNILRFFRDNANREESSGAVSRIRLYDQAMTPAQVAALGT